ncbi:mRNA-decapping enzyme 1B-like [Strongylocentrotus purpuratus]|uniref:mRNA-decapping enzyme C-terminal domain-containing protein n=1 Tax=Strongylocentrotus purpuratus TaxID=7668 RepID=A0A7M7SSI9_STRPU|nr:mRNA-decapping enzyme 1B-like [Strongylocentrotus purpuratus]
MIMNRLSLHNLTEPITKDLDYTLQEPFLLYKTAKAICGIWFYNRKDCIRFAELIQRLLVKIRQEGSQPVAASMPAPTDILSMLSKAQHEYKQGTKKKRSASESGPSPIGPGGDAGGGGAGVIRPIPVKVSPGHVSKTDDQITARGGAKPKSSPMGPRFQRSVSMQDTRSKTTTTSSITTTAGQGDGSKVIPVLQRLMSQGAEERPVISEKVQVHTLESLEKMHTTKTTEGATVASAGKKPEVQSLESIESLHIPGGGVSDKRPSAAAAGTAGAPSNAESSQHLQRLLQRLQSGGADTASGQGLLGAAPSSTAIEPSQERETPEKLPSPSSQQTDMNQALLDKLKCGAPPVNLLKPSGATLTPNLLVSQSPGGTADPGRAPPAMKQLFPAPMETRKTPSPPTTILGIPSNLLTPELLRTRSTSESSSTLLSPLKLSGSVQTGQGQAVGKRPDPLLQRGAPSLLTKEQLAATLTHLLNTDDDFLSKIHSAYTHSLQRHPP